MTKAKTKKKKGQSKSLSKKQTKIIDKKILQAQKKLQEIEDSKKIKQKQQIKEVKTDTIQIETSNDDQKVELNTSTAVKDNLEVGNEYQSNTQLKLDTLLLSLATTKNKNEKEQLINNIKNLVATNSELQMYLISKDGLNSNILDNDTAEKTLSEVISNPRMIHKYFELRKKIASSAFKNELKFNNNTEKWVFDDHTYCVEDLIPVKSNMKAKIFIHVADNLLEKSQKTGMTNLYVLAKNSKDINGIKFRDDKGVVVLKTKVLGDTRLIADTIMQNKNGNLLVVFKYKTNHKGVENWSRKASNTITMLEDSKDEASEKEDVKLEFGDILLSSENNSINTSLSASESDVKLVGSTDFDN